MKQDLGVPMKSEAEFPGLDGKRDTGATFVEERSHVRQICNLSGASASEVEEARRLRPDRLQTCLPVAQPPKRERALCSGPPSITLRENPHEKMGWRSFAAPPRLGAPCTRRPRPC